MNHRQFVLLAIVSVIAISLRAQEDSKIDYSDRQYLGNISYDSSNPVSLKYMPITDLADIHVGYRHADGDFHLIDQAARTDSWIASFTGMKRVKNVTFGGGIVYNNSTLNDRRWNNTLFVSPANPFIIGDSVLSKFNTETFHLNGCAAYAPNDRFTLALEATYNVGSSATQKDPRPETTGMRFCLTPGVEYRFNRHTVGLSVGVEWLSEQATHTVLRTTTKQYVFLFQGLGVYEAKDALGYVRKYNGTRYSAQLQYSFNNNENARVSDFFQVGYYNESESAVDGGSSVKYKGGKYLGNGISVLERLMLRASETSIHNFTLRATVSNSTGRWYTQRQSTDASGNLIYEVVNESDNLESNMMNGGISYRFDRLNVSRISTLQVELSADYDHAETTNKVYGAKEIYSNAYISASAVKRFHVKKGWLGAGVNAKYRMSLDKSLDIDGMPQTYSIIMKKYTLPQYDALIADYWQAGVMITYSLPMKLMGYKSTMEIALNGDYRNRVESIVTGSNDRFHIGASIGFVF